jgi:hypothetical protein
MMSEDQRVVKLVVIVNTIQVTEMGKLLFCKQTADDNHVVLKMIGLGFSCRP